MKLIMEYTVMVKKMDKLAKNLSKNIKPKMLYLVNKASLENCKKRLLQAVLDGELTDHLGYDKHERSELKDNSRNGYSNKVVKDENGEVDIQVPRDRSGTF
jgi:putative transposase